MKKVFLLLFAAILGCINMYALSIDDLRGRWSSDLFDLNTSSDTHTISMAMSLSIDDIAGVCYSTDSTVEHEGFLMTVTIFSSTAGVCTVSGNTLSIDGSDIGWESEYDPEYTMITGTDSNNFTYENAETFADVLGQNIAGQLKFPDVFELRNITLDGDVMYATWGSGYRIKLTRTSDVITYE